jgi:hypothetical protein
MTYVTQGKIRLLYQENFFKPVLGKRVSSAKLTLE